MEQPDIRNGETVKLSNGFHLSEPGWGDIPLIDESKGEHGHVAHPRGNGSVFRGENGCNFHAQNDFEDSQLPTTTVGTQTTKCRPTIMTSQLQGEPQPHPRQRFNHVNGERTKSQQKSSVESKNHSARGQTLPNGSGQGNVQIRLSHRAEEALNNNDNGVVDFSKKSSMTFADFCQTTSLHGWKFLRGGAPIRRPLRVGWMAVVIGSLGVAIFFLSNSFIDFQSSTVQTTQDTSR